MTRSFGKGSGKRTPASEQEPCGDDEAAGDLKHPEPLGEHAQREDRCEEGLKIGTAGIRRTQAQFYYAIASIPGP